MAEDKHQLVVTIGAALSSGFNAVISGSLSKIKKVGALIKGLEKQSLISSDAVVKLKNRYNSLFGSIYRQQQIVEKRGVYRSQIMDMVALGASLAAPIKSAMDFETSLSNIAAVVNFPEPDGLKKLGSRLTEISLKVPKTADELASIAAIGGSFQVPLKDLTKFTEEVAKTAVAWRANSDETAQRVGNLMKVFNVETAQLSEYFDAFNDLGNKAGASADSILKGVNKASGGLSNFKIALPQAAALTSTIISFGENAETAGAQVSTMLQRLSIAPKLGADAQKALHSIGLSSVTLPKMIKEDPNKALDTIFNALEKLDPENRATVMYSIFGRGASATVGKLVNNLDLYRKNLQIVANAKTLKGSRDGDYSIVMGTAKAQLGLFQNSLSTFIREIGLSLLPGLRNVLTSINAIIKPIVTWMKNNRELTTTITTTLAGLISFRIATFALGYASTFLFGGLNRLVIVFKGLRLGLSLVGVAFKAFMGWPAVIAAAAWLIWDNWETVQIYLTKIWEVVKPYWDSFKKTMDEFGITDFILNAWLKVQDFFSGIWSGVTELWDAFYKKADELGIVEPILSAWGQVKNFFSGIWNGVTEVWDKFCEKVKSLSITQSIIAAWENVKKSLSDIFDYLSSAFKNVTEKISGFLSPVTSLWNQFKGKIPGIGDAITSKTVSASGLKMPKLQQLAPEGNRNQTNNFEINIQASPGENGEAIARKVTDKMSQFSKTFLFDEGVRAI